MFATLTENKIKFKTMSFTKDTIAPCLMCGRKYVDIETQGTLCDSCQQYNQVEYNFEVSLGRIAKSENGYKKIADMLNKNLDIKLLIKELTKY